MTTAAGSEERVGQNWELLEAESARGQNISEWSTLDAGFAISGQEALLAIGPDSLRHLLLPTVEEAQLEDTQSSGVQILKRELILKNATNIRFVDVVCLKDRLHDLFTLLATDIIARLDVSRTDVSRQCVILLHDWRELFSRESSNILGIDSLTGSSASLSAFVNLSVRNHPVLKTGPGLVVVSMTFHFQVPIWRSRLHVYVTGVLQASMASISWPLARGAVYIWLFLGLSLSGQVVSRCRM